jgi:hypothetical protein
MRWVNPRVIPARGAPADTGPPYGVGLRDGLHGQAGVALAFELGEVPRPCVQSRGDIAERSRMPPSRVAARLRSTRFGRIDRSSREITSRLNASLYACHHQLASGYRPQLLRCRRTDARNYRGGSGGLAGAIRHQFGVTPARSSLLSSRPLALSRARPPGFSHLGRLAAAPIRSGARRATRRPPARPEAVAGSARGACLPRPLQHRDERLTTFHAAHRHRPH